MVVKPLNLPYAIKAIAARPARRGTTGSQAGAEIALLCEGGLVRIWNAKTGSVTAQIQQPRYLVALTYSADGGHLVTLCEDGAVRVWGADDHKLRATLRATLRVINETVDARGYTTTDWITTTPEGYYAASPGADQYILWRANGKLMPCSAYKSVYDRPDLVAAALEH